LPASFKLRGQRELRAAVAAQAKKEPLRVKAAIVKEAETIMTASKKLVPVKTGNLRASGHVEIHPTRIRVDLVYGGPAADYALRVHEDLDAFHRVGQAKYLEEPLNDAIPGMAQRIANDSRFE